MPILGQPRGKAQVATLHAVPKYSVTFRLFTFLRALLAGDIEFFNFLSCPGGLAQEFKARRHGGVTGETADFDILGQFFPAIICNQKVHYLFQGDAVQRVFSLLFVHVSECHRKRMMSWLLILELRKMKNGSNYTF